MATSENKHIVFDVVGKAYHSTKVPHDYEYSPTTQAHVFPMKHSTKPSKPASATGCGSSASARACSATPGWRPARRSTHT